MLKVKTANGGGVAASTELVSNYGLRWADGGKRARLHDYFSRSTCTAVHSQVSVPAPPTTPKAPAGAPPQAPAPAPAPAPAVVPKQEPAGADQKTAEPSKAQAPAAADNDKERSPKEKAFEDNGILICELQDPKVTWKLILNPEAPLIQIRLFEDKNRKLAKHHMLKWFSQGKLVRSESKPPNSVPYSDLIFPSCLVIDVANDKTIVTLKDLIKSTNASELHGFQAFPQGSCPNKLQRDESVPVLYLSNIDNLVAGMWQALQSIPHMKLAWGFKLNGSKLSPQGLGLVSVKQLNLQANEIHTMPM